MWLALTRFVRIRLPAFSASPGREKSAPSVARASFSEVMTVVEVPSGTDAGNRR